jgi:hypothetical protein
MMSAAQCDAVRIEMATDILGSELFQGERYNSAPSTCLDGPQHAYLRDRLKTAEQAVRQTLLVVLNSAPIKSLHPVERGT